MLIPNARPLIPFVGADGAEPPITSASNRLTVAATLLILLGAACSESSQPVGPITEPRGRVDVSIAVTGGDPDDDGFVVAVGSGALRRSFDAPATTVSFDFAAGTHPLMLENVSPNCSVTGDNPRPVTVVKGAITTVAFAVTCETTGITVTTRTTGIDLPLSYDVLVTDKRPGVPIPVNGSAIISRLPAGAYTVTLAVGENCAVAGGKSIPIEVVNRTVTPVTFQVDCSAVVRVEMIAYTSSVGEGTLVGVVRPDGTSAVELSQGHSPAWSRDGTRLLFSTMQCDYEQSYNDLMCNGSLAIIDPETRALTTVSNSIAGTEPAWSPATDEIVFVRCCAKDDWAQLYVMQMDGSAGRMTAPIVFQATNFTPTRARNPAWSPDGQRIAFSCYIKPVYSICVVKRDGTELVRLTTGPAQHTHPAWSPDGRTIAFTSWSPGERDVVSLIPADGGPITSLTTGTGAAWSRDGKKLVFNRDRALHTMDADGTNITQLLPLNAYDAAWRP